MKKQLRSRQRQLGKTAAIKAGASLCLWTEIQLYGLEAGKIAFFEKRIQAVHSNVFLYFTGLPVSSSLYCLYGSRARLHNSV